MSRFRTARSPEAPADFKAAENAMTIGLDRTEEDALHYQDWLEELCLPYLGEKCLEFGSGYGYLTERLARGRTIVASDVSDKNLELLEARFANSENVTVRRIDVAEFASTDQYDSIVMLNVLEHIEDDVAALSALRAALVPGGRLLLYVPAFMLLYSEQDRAIGHFRRYRKRSLRQLMVEAGFEVLEDRYVNSIGALGWFLYCRLLRRRASDQIAVSTCDRIVIPIVRRLERRIRPPFGLSIFAVGSRV
jgi:SAM-dependent methyltransferase